MTIFTEKGGGEVLVGTGTRVFVGRGVGGLRVAVGGTVGLGVKVGDSVSVGSGVSVGGGVLVGGLVGVGVRLGTSVLVAVAVAVKVGFAVRVGVEVMLAWRRGSRLEAEQANPSQARTTATSRIKRISNLLMGVPPFAGG